MPRTRFLDREKILVATLRQAQSTDPGALSYRNIAAELEVDPAAIYRYFDSKQELMAASLDRLWEQLVSRVDPALPWRERLEAGASNCYELVSTHPGVGVDAGHRVTGGPGEFALIQAILEAMTDAGLSRSDVIRFYGTFTSTVLSLASSLAASEMQVEMDDPGASRPWLTDHLVADPSRFPLVFEYAAEVEAMTHRSVFDETVGTILDAVQSRTGA